MSRFVDVAAADEISPGKGRAYAVEGQMVAIFNDSGTYLAIDDFCPHMGASLAEGWLDNGCVSCPWHAWRFQLKDGAWLDNPKIKATIYPVRVVNGRIEVEIA